MRALLSTIDWRTVREITSCSLAAACLMASILMLWALAVALEG